MKVPINNFLCTILALGGIVVPPSPGSVPSLPETALLSDARQSIEAAEYFASPTDRGLQAPNRAQDLRTFFEPRGLRIEPRSTPGETLTALRTARYGRRGHLVDVAAGTVATDGPRVENRRQGLVEWYVNSAAGLEHGYTVSDRPAGDGELAVEIAFEGARVSVSDGEATIVSAAGRTFDYGHLVVVDATGRELPAWMETAGDSAIRLVIDDAGAAYPVVVDPLLSSTTDATLFSTEPNSQLGACVASAGDVNGDGFADVIVGAPQFDAGGTDEGAAFVFHGSATGIAGGNQTTAAAMLQSDVDNAHMGSSVASAGDVNGDGYDDVIVGADNLTDGESNEGGAFVFHGGPMGVGNGTIATADSSLQSNQLMARFGTSVASAGDVNGDGYADVIIGAPAFTMGAGEDTEGGAFVFHGGAAGIPSGTLAAASATIQSNQSSAQLGGSVASAGDVNGDGYSDVIVGAFGWDGTPLSGIGLALVFHGGMTGIGNGDPNTADSARTGAGGNELFGQAVASAGDVNGDGFSDVVVTSLTYSNGQTSEGAAFVFHGGASGIGNGDSSTAATTLEGNQANAQFGFSASGAGDVNGDGYADVVVSANQYSNGQMFEGAVFVYHGRPAGIPNGGSATADSTIELNAAGAQIGDWVASAGDVNGDGYADVILGAQNFVSNVSPEGAAFVSTGGAEGVRDGNPATASATIQSNDAAAQLGWSLASAGDVNGDGYADVIVGAPFFDAGLSNVGAAIVLHGGPNGIASGGPVGAAAVLSGANQFMFFGGSVASAGDVNGDGYGDVIVGAEDYADGQGGEGGAFVFHGGPSGVGTRTSAMANAVLQSDQLNASFGGSVAGAGDVNGDGYADVIVSARSWAAGQSEEGAAFVFHGSPAGVPSGNPGSADAAIESNQATAVFGISVAGAGDVNGDGYADVVVGASLYDAGEADEGAAFVFHGSPAGIASGSILAADAVLESNQALAMMGSSVATAGDVNGDSFADVIVGASNHDSSMGHGDQGAAFVFHGSPAGVPDGNPMTANGAIESRQSGARLGENPSSVASAGDVNGDGYADVIAGAALYDLGTTSEGAAFVVHGGPTGIGNVTPTSLNATFQSDQFEAFLGMSVAGAGDVNGDGFADVIVGANAYDDGEMSEGAAFVFRGNGDGLGRTSLARQLRGGASSTPVEPWGSTVDVDDFQVRLTSTHPAGRGRVKLEIQAVPAGQNWGGPGQVSVTSATWTDVTATSGGVALTETIPGLASSTLYRWRARLLYAPFTMVASPVAPSHGPWRRLRGQAFEADLRTGAPCGAGCAGGDTAGIYVPGTGSWFLRNSNSPGPADSVFGYGPAGLGWTAMEGDWDGDGDDTAGLYDPSTGNFFLKNSNAAGGADLVYGFGPAGLGWKPLSGDWDGDGDDTVGLYDPVNGNFFLRNSHSPGAADLVYGLGPAGLGWIPLVGDWNGDNVDTIGLYDPVNGNVFLRNSHAPGAADLVYGFGPAGLGWITLAGDWDGDGDDTIGLYDPGTGNYFLRNSHAPGGADVVFGYGPAGSVPIMGDWDGL